MHPDAESGVSRPTTAIFIPVKNGMPLLRDVVRAAASQGADEFLIIDSGSTDGSVEVAREAGATVIEIPPESFSHGLTRNLALEHTTADILCYLTQDASPVEGWLRAYVDAFAEDERIAVVFGPHHPRPGTSPMIARELTDFFAPFSPDGRVHTQARIDEPGYNPEFLHNANAAYRRSALLEVPFRDIAYAEDQAYGRDVLAAGWLKAYQPRAGVLHAHDFPWLQFMRRYFDEYRGLHETTGLQMSFYPRGIARDAVRLAQADVRWLDQLGVESQTQRRWFLRALAHHGGRRIAAFAGGRAHELPHAVQRILSLEGRAGATGNPQPPAVAVDSGTDARVDPAPFAAPLDIVRELQTHGPVPLDPSRATPKDEPLKLVLLIETTGPDDTALDVHLDLIAGLEARGHRCAIRIHDPEHRLPVFAQRALARRLADRRHAVRAPVTIGLGAWTGADVAIATNWRTAHLALRLPRLGSRAYLLPEDEHDGLAAGSVERAWAARVLQEDLQLLCLSASRAARVREQSGRPVTTLAPWVDQSRFGMAADGERRDDTVVLYRPAGDPHGAGGAGIVLDELLRQRAGTRVISCGPGAVGGLSFRHHTAGTGGIDAHADLLARGTVGLLLGAAARPNVALAMLASGLPYVGARTPDDPYGIDDETSTPLVADPTVPALVAELRRQLDDPQHRQRCAEHGIRQAAAHPLEGTVSQVEECLRHALAPATGAGR